jgi:hypothetical protein
MKSLKLFCKRGDASGTKTERGWDNRTTTKNTKATKWDFKDIGERFLSQIRRKVVLSKWTNRSFFNRWTFL